MRTLNLPLQSLRLPPKEGNEIVWGAKPTIAFTVMGGWILQIAVYCGDRSANFAPGSSTSKPTQHMYRMNVDPNIFMDFLEVIVKAIDDGDKDIDFSLTDKRWYSKEKKEITSVIDIKIINETAAIQIRTEGDLEIPFPFRGVLPSGISGSKYVPLSKADASINTLRRWCVSMIATLNLSTSLVSKINEFGEDNVNVGSGGGVSDGDIPF